MKLSFCFLLLSLLNACSYIDSQRIAPNYAQAFKGIKVFTLGSEDNLITKQLVDDTPYASIKVKVGKGPSGLLILEEISNTDLVYISADEVRFVIRDGVIIRTSGFDNNLIRRLEPEDSLLSFLESGKKEQKYFIFHSYDLPQVTDLRLEVTLKKMQIEQVEILGESYNLLKVEQILENDYLGWKKKNIFWISPQDNFIWKSLQHISPLLPEISLEVTKKFIK
tara:strand:- start:209 stop:877 length:669 start_codon:yes stop_codon:yes gene_type:complete